MGLDGSKSNDPDNGPQPLTYEWSFKQLPQLSTLTDDSISNADQAQASFTADAAGTYVLTLRVFDGLDSDEDDVSISVSELNVPPNTNAGLDQTVVLGQEAVLNGGQSNDPDNGPKPLSYQWRFVSVANGSVLTNADIIGAEAATASFTPDAAGSYVLRLEVSDGLGSATDTVVITVTPPASFWDVSDRVAISTANQQSLVDPKTRKIASISYRCEHPKRSREDTITVPLHAVFLLSASGVVMPEASGVNEDGRYYYNLGGETEIQELKSGQTITFGIKFVRPSFRQVHLRNQGLRNGALESGILLR